jgi:hypothetical protein
LSIDAKEIPMPLTLTVTEGVLPEGSIEPLFVRLSQAMLQWHGLTGNQAMTPNVVGAVHVVPRGRSFAGLEPAPVVFVEWKVPSFAFTDRQVQLGYIEEATRLVEEASGGRHPRTHIWVNVSHAVDGTWGVAGQALTNAQLFEQVSKG